MRREKEIRTQFTLKKHSKETELTRVFKPTYRYVKLKLNVVSQTPQL